MEVDLPEEVMELAPRLVFEADLEDRVRVAEEVHLG